MAGDHRFYGLIGFPITHVRSPEILNAYFAEHNLPGRLIPFGVRSELLEVTIAGLRNIENLHGFFVTMPYKESILPLLDDASETARIAGAVNIVRRSPEGQLIGDQLDGPGFVGAMKLANITVHNATAFVAGAGGVAAGICCAMAQAGIACINIANRNVERAERLASRLHSAFPKTEFNIADRAPGPDVDIVVNATSLGISPDDPLPVDLSNTREGIFVGDVVNVPRNTALLEAARTRGCNTQHGSAMLGPQIELALKFLGEGREAQ